MSRHLNLGNSSEVNKHLNEISSYHKSQVASEAGKYLLEDPNLFEYDDYVAQKKDDQIREEQQAKKNKNTESRFLGTILKASEKRKTEQLLIKSKMNAKESLKLGTEVYISESFKRQHQQAQQFEIIDSIQEKINESQPKQGIMGSLFQQSQFQGGNREIQPQINNTFEIIESIVTKQLDAEVEHQIQQTSTIIPEVSLPTEDKSRSRSKEKPQESKEDKIQKYKQRYNERKSQLE